MPGFRFTRRDTLALAAGAAVASWSLPAHAQAPKRGGTLVVATTQTPRHLNPAVQSGTATMMPGAQLFASPLRYDDKWNPQPYLAESWKLADDAKSLTLNLRKDALFHDGKPVTSTDVAFSIMAIKANHPFKTMLEPVEKVDTPDAHTAIIRLSRPHPALLLAMSPALCPIMPKHVYDGKDLQTHPQNSANVVGSGPFKWVEFTPGQRIVLERFDKFFIPDRPYVDKVVINLNPDAASLDLDFGRGQIHLRPFITQPTTLKRYASNKDFVVIPKGYEGIGPLNWLAFNCAKKPFSDPRVRHAIAMTIDKNFVAKVLMGGFAVPADSPIPPSSPFYAPNDIVKYPFDLKKAAALLDEAGLKAAGSGDRFALTIDYLPGVNDQQKTVAEYIRGQLKKVNIAAEVRASADFPSWAKRLADHDFDISMDQLYTWGDPTIGVARTYLSTNIRPVIWTNTQSYKNPKVDELLEAGAREADPAKRKADYAQFQKLVTEDLPIEYINVIPYHTLANNKVGNIPTSIWGPLSPFDEVYLT